MTLPEDASIITEEQRDTFDTYTIASGRTYCFEFIIPDNEIMEVAFVHTMPQAQDFSLRCWFATVPLGQQAFPFSDSVDVFNMGRHIRTIAVGTPQSNALYKLPADQIVYVMVQNMQNAENFFELTFNIKA